MHACTAEIGSSVDNCYISAECAISAHPGGSKTHLVFSLYRPAPFVMAYAAVLSVFAGGRDGGGRCHGELGAG